MITVRLMGGLGNQMFQYAAGRALAHRRGTGLRLDLGWYRYEGSFAAAQRAFELAPFELEAELTEIPAATVARWERPRHRWHVRRTPTVVRKADDDLRFDPAVFAAPDDTLLIGFWQSERYFADAADAIRQDFVLRAPPAGRNAEFAERIAEGNCVSVHVRRGDYVAEAVTHGTLAIDYYERAVAHVSERVESPTLVVFSDDPEWSRRSLRFDWPTVFVDGNEGHGVEDLRLMTLCRHHIVANSSFSWWGAWLGAGEDGVVVAPARWFREESIDTLDLIPPRWVRL